MRSVMPHPCIGSSCSAFSTSMSSVPCKRSPLSLATPFLSIDERRLGRAPSDCQGDGAAPLRIGRLRGVGSDHCGSEFESEITLCCKLLKRRAVFWWLGVRD